MIFMTTLFAALTMMTVAYVLRKAALAFAAALLWIVFGVHSYTLSLTPAGGAWDVYYALVWLGVAMVLMCVLEPAVMRPKKEDIKEDITLDEIDQYEKDWETYSRRSRIPRVGRYKRRER